MTNLLAALMMVVSMAAFAAEDAIIKHLSGSLPVGQVMALIGAAGAVVFGLLAARAGARLLDPVALRGVVLLRNLSEMIGAGAIVTAIALAPLSVVTAILQAMPLAVTLGAALFLGEPVGWRRWSAIVVGFAGVMIVLRPWSEAFDPAAALTLITVAMLTIRDLATRRIPPGVHSLQLSGWGFLAVIPAGLILMVLMRQAPAMPATAEWAWLAAATVAGIFGYAALVFATRRGEVAVTTPLRYTRLVFAMAIGMLIFGERPDALTYLGSALIVGAGLYTLWREMVRRRAPSAPAPAPL
jgi:drug/metabolite transporter (DMT)-like permease